QIPAEFADVTRVILQSAKRIGVASRDESAFDICVVGHLREVKDSLRAAEASRQLPKQSKIRILQVGGVHEDEYQERIKVELAENPRFKWLGELDEQEVADVIASSQAMVISSQFEGGARVVGEAVVHQTPVLSSRIDGVMGLLGEEYPGYFEFGDTYALLQLLERFENDDAFSAVLRQATSEAASQFSPELERAAWKKLMDELAE
ncbi:MAG: glycosyltransferase, partial [Verrucomicrobiota bacterium]